MKNKLDELEDLIEKKHIKEVLVAIPSISRISRNEIITSLKTYLPNKINIKTKYLN